MIGRLYFAAAPDGCVGIVESDYPFGTHTVSSSSGSEMPIIPENRGRVCVGPGGYNACTPYAPVPVESATWGNIEAQYGR